MDPNPTYIPGIIILLLLLGIVVLATKKAKEKWRGRKPSAPTDRPRLDDERDTR